MIEVQARAFVWGMVRKIVGALRGYAIGRLSPAELTAGIGGTCRLMLPMAEARGLVLWEVEYPIEWGTHWVGPNRHQRSYLSRNAADRWLDENMTGAWTDTE